MKTKGISSSAYSLIQNCLTAEITRLQEQVRQETEVGEAVAAAELMGKVKAALSEFINVHCA